jgi:hypothetical protein
VTENTQDAHKKRVDLVKTKENAKYELETIKDSIEKFTEQITKTIDNLKNDNESLKTLQGKL